MSNWYEYEHKQIDDDQSDGDFLFPLCIAGIIGVIVLLVAGVLELLA